MGAQRHRRCRCHINSLPLIWLVTLSALSLTYASIASSQAMPPAMSPAILPTTIPLTLSPTPTLPAAPVPGGDGEASEWSDDQGDEPDDLLVSPNSRLEPELESEPRTSVNTVAADQRRRTHRDQEDQDQHTVASQPLQTLKKLQQMLDETDYMTTKGTRSDDSSSLTTRAAQSPTTEPPFPFPPAPTNTERDYNDAYTHTRSTPMQQQQSHQSQSPWDVDMPPDLPPQHLYDHNPEDRMMPAQDKTQWQPQRQELESGIPPATTSAGDPTPHHNPSSPKQGERHVATTAATTATATATSSPLWTSKDRSKYKKMQQMQRRAEEERRRLEQHLLQQQQQQHHHHPGSSSDDEQDGLTDTDDGLGYTLPNLPVYMSDAEADSSDSGEPLQPLASSSSTTSSSTTAAAAHAHIPLPLSPPPTMNAAAYYENQHRADVFMQQPPQQQQQQQQPQQQQYTYANGQQQFTPPPPNMQPNSQVIDIGSRYPPYGNYYNPQQQLQQQQQQQPPFSNLQQQQHQQQHYTTPQHLQTFPNPQQQTHQMLAAQYTAAWGQTPQRFQALPNPSLMTNNYAIAPPEERQLVMTDVPTTLAEATSRINFDSIQKISLLFVGVATLSYCAVSPRNLQPLSEYNRHFYDNLRLVALCTIAPLANFLLVCDARENDINSVITAFYTSFTVGYALAFILEILLTTGVRLGVFAIWEPNIFKLSPKVPTLVLPWVLRENKYRPKRITLFAADFLSSCVASPIIEEYVKLKILQLSVPLPRNFQWYTKTLATGTNKRNKRRKRRVAEAAPRNPNEGEVTNINSYITHMLAVSLGMKLCDSSRRILMYTKAIHSNKSFYAFVRGLFPIQELCGTMTALALAKRDVLGVNMAQWQMLFPAVFIHGMANLRGMKPLFKWNSATPWSEMQLSPLNTADDSTVSQLINKGFAKLMWLVLLGRVLGYCIKNYYLVSRQARKRTTTYAGKQAAFSAELAAAEMLKKTKDKK